MPIKAIVFDFDGTMIDTEGAIFRSWQDVYRQYGQDLPLSEWARVVGAPGLSFDPHDQLEQLVGAKIPREQLEADRLSREREYINALAVQPGVMELIDEATARGIGLAVASNSTFRWVERHLKRLNLLDRFGAICTADQVENPKPHPDLYLLAAERLGVAPHEAVAIEDSPTGALAAVSAGMYCVVVPIELTKGLTFETVDLTLSSLAEIDLDGLLSLASRPPQQ